jgi:hypothetical protein
MHLDSRTRSWLALFVGLVVACVLVSPAVDLMHGIAPNSAPTGPGVSRRYSSVALFVHPMAFHVATGVFAFSALGQVKLRSIAGTVSVPLPQPSTQHLPLLC